MGVVPVGATGVEQPKTSATIQPVAMHDETQRSEFILGAPENNGDYIPK
jgi:hypothetical protein